MGQNTKFKFYKLTVPEVIQGSEFWIIKEDDKGKLKAPEMRLLCRVKVCAK